MNGDGDRDGPGDVHPHESEDRPELDVEAAFAALVAEYDRPHPEGVGPWPAAEDVDPEAPGGGASATTDTGDLGTDLLGPDAAGPDRGRAGRRGPRHRLPDGSSTPGGFDLGSGYSSDDDGDDDGDASDRTERFVPPEPPPIAATDLATRLAWLGVLGGPLVLLVAALVMGTLPTLVVLFALAAFIGGFVALVARLPRDRDDGPDDGAVV